MEEFRRIAVFNRLCGVDVEEISPSEVGRLFPLAQNGGHPSAGSPHAGTANPVDVTMALAKGARQRGVRIIEGVTVERVTAEAGGPRGSSRLTGRPCARVRATLSRQALVTRAPRCPPRRAADYVADCAGMWARQLGEANGARIPTRLQSTTMRSQTPCPRCVGLQEASMRSLHAGPPSCCRCCPAGGRLLARDRGPAATHDIRPEAGGLMVGLFEGQGEGWGRGGGGLTVWASSRGRVRGQGGQAAGGLTVGLSEGQGEGWGRAWGGPHGGPLRGAG